MTVPALLESPPFQQSCADTMPPRSAQVPGAFWLAALCPPTRAHANAAVVFVDVVEPSVSVEPLEARYG